MPRPTDPGDLNERQRLILQAVVEDYIETAEPVGSRTLTRRNRQIDLSPASVRNCMADLESLGYLSAPHASAGRIPTAEAFRIYVGQLALRGRISARDQTLINAVTTHREGASPEISEVLRDASRVLSTVAQQAAVVFLPRLEDVVFSDIEFVPIREQSVLAVFVAKSGLVQHRVLEVELGLDRDELRRMSNYLHSLLEGKTLGQVRQLIFHAMRDEQAQADQMMRQALLLGERALPPANTSGTVMVEGERSLLEQPEFADIGKMRKLLRAFEEKTVILRLLDAAACQRMPMAAAERSDTQVLFGADGEVQELQDLAVVLARYGSADSPSGQVGIVGPLRMNYSRLIPLVEMTAAGLAQSFSGSSEVSSTEPIPPAERFPEKS